MKNNVYRTSQSFHAGAQGDKKPAPTPAAPTPEEAPGPRDLDEAITELRKTEPPRENVPAPSKPPAPQQTKEFPLKRQLENPQAGFITRTPKAPKPDLNGALTEAGRQVQKCGNQPVADGVEPPRHRAEDGRGAGAFIRRVQKRNADTPRKTGEPGFIRRVKRGGGRRATARGVRPRVVFHWACAFVLVDLPSIAVLQEVVRRRAQHRHSAFNPNCLLH